MSANFFCRYVGHRLPRVTLTRPGSIARDRCRRCNESITREVVVCSECNADGCRRCRGGGFVIQMSDREHPSGS